MRIQSGSMRIRRVHIKSGSVQTGFKPVCFQSTSGGGFDPVRSGSKWIRTCSHAIYMLFVVLYDNKSINAHVRTRRFNEVKTAGWTNDQTRALVSVWGHANVQGQLDGVTRNRTIFERIAIFAGTVRTVMVMRCWRNGHVTKMTLHLWVCNSVNTRKRIEPVWMRIQSSLQCEWALSKERKKEEKKAKDWVKPFLITKVFVM